MDKGMNFFYILSAPLGYVMEWIYKLLPNYGWDIILFTLLINLVKIPLQLSQQKSMAKMSAFQPMLQEIQTKYKDKPEKQQAELMKLQQDFGYKPTAGCMPMLLNFLVMFGVIGVVYNPLERIFHISAAALASSGEAMTAAGISFTAITRDTNIIAQVIAGNGGVLGCFSAEQIATITEFSQHMNFLGIDLTRIPQIGLSLDLVLPLLSVVTMFLSTHISMKASGQQMQGSMKVTMYLMPLMYLFFCFTYPLAFSLYYVISNIVMTVQTQVMRKIYDPEKMRKEVEAEIAAKRKQEKRGVKNTTITVTAPKTGKTMERDNWSMQPGEYHVSVLGVVQRPDKKYLITQRKMDKPWGAGWWEFPGGAVRAGEEPEAAVRREVAEETGLDVSDVAAEKVLTYKREDPNDDNNYFMVVYRLELDADESMVAIQEEEVEDFAFADVARIRSLDDEGIFLHYNSISSIFE